MERRFFKEGLRRVPLQLTGSRSTPVGGGMQGAVRANLRLERLQVAGQEARRPSGGQQVLLHFPPVEEGRGSVSCVRFGIGRPADEVRMDLVAPVDGAIAAPQLPHRGRHRIPHALPIGVDAEQEPVERSPAVARGQNVGARTDEGRRLLQPCPGSSCALRPASTPAGAQPPPQACDRGSDVDRSPLPDEALQFRRDGLDLLCELPRRA
jgi:hypothetical protein